MVIFFNVEEARNMLLVQGTVFTLRPRRRTGKDIAVVGGLYDYKILADVTVEEVEPIYTPVALMPYVPFSGVASAEEWFNLAKSFYSGNPQLYVYRVKLLRRRMYY
jgi:hypothetical protein